MVNSVGRPIGGSDARDLLLKAAKQHAIKGDLDRTSNRMLAEEVGASHSLVNYYFGGRAGLIAEALGIDEAETLAPHAMLQNSLTSDGTLDVSKLADSIVALWEHPVHGPSVAELTRAATDSTLTQHYVHDYVYSLLAHLVGRAAGRRMAVIIVGFIFARYLIRVPAIAGLTPKAATKLLRSMLAPGPTPGDRSYRRGFVTTY